jgi:hypothetical protein
VLGPTAARPVRMARARRDLQVCELAGFGSGNTGDDLAGRSVMLPEGMLNNVVRSVLWGNARRAGRSARAAMLRTTGRCARGIGNLCSLLVAPSDISPTTSADSGQPGY